MSDRAARLAALRERAGQIAASTQPYLPDTLWLLRTVNELLAEADAQDRALDSARTAMAELWRTAERATAERDAARAETERRCSNEAARERDRFRAAWQSARRRAQARGEGIARLCEDRDSYKLWMLQQGTRANAAVVKLGAARADIERLRQQVADLDRALGETIDERDAAQDMADKLAYAIAPIEVIGEHSSDNCPWDNAYEIATTPTAEEA